MRKLASLFLLLFLFSSCTDNVTRNNPSLQGLKDNVLWRAVDSDASIQANGVLTITGIKDHETLILSTRFATEGTYVLGQNELKKATYIDATDEPIIYSTGTNHGDGQIVITEYDEVNMTVSGTFRFNAVNVDDNPLGGEILNFQQGVFYKVPIVPEI